MTTGAARPNPQGSFNVSNVTISQTFILHELTAEIKSVPNYTVNNVSYLTPTSPLKLADTFVKGSGVYKLDQFSTHVTRNDSVRGVFVTTGYHKEWIELVFNNNLEVMDSWHLDGYGFYVFEYVILLFCA